MKTRNDILPANGGSEAAEALPDTETTSAPELALPEREFAKGQGGCYQLVDGKIIPVEG